METYGIFQDRLIERRGLRPECPKRKNQLDAALILVSGFKFGDACPERRSSRALFSPDFEAEIAQSLCHTPVYRRKFIGLDGAIKFKGTELAKPGEFQARVIKEIMEPLYEFAGSKQEVLEGFPDPFGVLSVLSPEFFGQVFGASLYEPHLLSERMKGHQALSQAFLRGGVEGGF